MKHVPVIQGYTHGEVKGFIRRERARLLLNAFFAVMTEIATIAYVLIAFACGFIVSTLIEAKRQQKREDNWNYWNGKSRDGLR